MKRRERTRQLIELGGQIAKAGLIDATDDGRAVFFGTLVEIASQRNTEDREQILQLWRRCGKRAFEGGSVATSSTSAGSSRPP